MVKRNLLTLLFALFWGGRLAAESQPVFRVDCYGENDGLPHRHVTQLLQDGRGLMWFATWNGLCRFDGYEFQTFKVSLGSDCNVNSDRFRDIALRPDGQICCKVDDAYILFDTRTYRFRGLTEDEARQCEADMRKYRQSSRLGKGDSVCWEDRFNTRWELSRKGGLKCRRASGAVTAWPLPSPLQQSTFVYTDRQGSLWALVDDGICRLSTGLQHAERLPQPVPAQVKCMFTDTKARLWVATKEDSTLRLYDRDSGRLLGYLGADGRLHSCYTPFPSAVYCVYESSGGELWLGCKPDGLYRLREEGDGRFRIQHLRPRREFSVYGMCEDRFGRLWLATLGDGLWYSPAPGAGQPAFRSAENYPADKARLVRFLHITRKGVLLAATTEGLVASQTAADASQMGYRLHQREAGRAESLSCNATMDIVEDDQGRIYLSTESGGINRTDSRALTDGQLSFEHFNTTNHRLPSDVVMAQALMADGSLIVVGSHLVSLIGKGGELRVLDRHYFNADYAFSDARPQPLGGGRWLFGLTDGAITTTEQQMRQPAYTPEMVLTVATILGREDDWAVGSSDSLVLLPRQRSLTLRFAALDYAAADRISYAFRLLPDTAWSHLGHDRSVTLPDLAPGTICLEVRSTNANGQWVDNARRLTIVVTPTFWESGWGRALMLLLAVGVLSLIVYTLLYIRRIKRKQRATLDAYLALLNRPEPDVSPARAAAAASPRVKPEDDAMIKRIMAFIEQNIGNSDASVGDMALAAATSRSGLQRKLKQSMGITPQALFQEARIKRAGRLLRETDKTVAEVAYACGFTDPKYFSRCFKQSTGQTPSEYKNAL